MGETVSDNWNLLGCLQVDIDTPHVSVTKLRQVSTGVTVSRLDTGRIVLSAHKDHRRVLVELSKEECRTFANRILEFLAADAAAR